MKMHLTCSSLESRIFSRQMEQRMPPDLVKNFITRTAKSVDHYIAVRSMFAKSLAALSIAAYVLGIGDRHPENILVDTVSGCAIAIDFGHAFGTGCSLLPVPELMPFRMTWQLQNIYTPLNTMALLKADMVRVFRALVDKKDLILSVLKVFVKEPLLEWMDKAQTTTNKRLHETTSTGAQASSSSSGGSSSNVFSMEASEYAWVPKEKIRIARLKLEGADPAWAMLYELAQNPTYLNYDESGSSHRSPKANPRNKLILAVAQTVARAGCLGRLRGANGGWSAETEYTASTLAPMDVHSRNSTRSQRITHLIQQILSKDEENASGSGSNTHHDNKDVDVDDEDQRQGDRRKRARIGADASQQSSRNMGRGLGGVGLGTGLSLGEADVDPSITPILGVLPRTYSIEKQVDTLLGMATDHEILAKTWVGWLPFL